MAYDLESGEVRYAKSLTLYHDLGRQHAAPARRRSVETVAEDVAARYISRNKAFSVYGVVFDDDGSVEPEATARHRVDMGTAAVQPV